MNNLVKYIKNRVSNNFKKHLPDLTSQEWIDDITICIKQKNDKCGADICLLNLIKECETIIHNILLFSKELNIDKSNLQARLNNVIDHFCKAMSEVSLTNFKDYSEPPWEKVQSNIYPTVRSYDKMIHIGHDTKDIDVKLIRRPLSTKTHILYVIDHENSMSFINRANIKKWDISTSILHKVAMSNLRKETKDNISFTGSKINIPQVKIPEYIYAFEKCSSYMSSYILSKSVYRLIAKTLGDTYYAIIPNNHHFYFAEHSSIVLKTLRKIALVATQITQHAITDEVFVIDSNSIKPV